MNPKIIYLHIPKTAGTSFRGIVLSTYKKNKLTWYGYNVAPDIPRYNEASLKDKFLVGGHKPISFYPENDIHLYCSLLRDPIERAASLFSYYTRPEAAVTDRDKTERTKVFDKWIENGIQPDSIVQSIKRCHPFLNQISNMQCAYLSRGDRTFDGVLQTIAPINIMIGTSDGIYALTKELTELFGWPELSPRHVNASVQGSHHGILQEEGAIELIRQHCGEDQKLYDYVQHKHAGLLNQIVNRDYLRNHLSYSPPQSRKVDILINTTLRALRHFVTR